jgi:hypothetical protein
VGEDLDFPEFPQASSDFYCDHRSNSQFHFLNWKVPSLFKDYHSFFFLQLAV